MENQQQEDKQTPIPEPLTQQPEPEQIIPDHVRENVTRDFTPRVLLDEDWRRWNQRR